jgi:hypothetical protein
MKITAMSSWGAGIAQHALLNPLSYEKEKKLLTKKLNL